jgi:hypothetical protein
MTNLGALLAPEDGIPYECGGKKYRASYITQAAAIAFEDYLEQYHIALLEKKRAFLTPEQYAEQADALARQLDEMAFAYHGPIARAALKAQRHATAFAAILLGVDAAEVVAINQADPAGFKALMDRIAARSAPAKREGGEGNGEGAGATST